MTLTSAGDRPPSGVGDTPDRLRGYRLGQIGRAAQQLLGSLDEGLELARGTSTYVFFGARIVRGWAIELVLVAALLPFLTAVVDLFALTRRRRLPLMPAIRSLRSRIAFWLWVAVVFEVLGLVGFWPHTGLRPPAPEGSSGTDWPVLGPGDPGRSVARRLAPRARAPLAAEADLARGGADRTLRRTARARR